VSSSDLLRRLTAAISHFVERPSPVFGEKGDVVKYALRNWKCRNCGRANATEIALNGTAICEYCRDVTLVQPSRIRDGVLLPSSYPTRHGVSTLRPERTPTR
jgi:hypothetical protein